MMRLIFVTAVCLVLGTSLYADEVYLENNDRITGKIIKETNQTVLIETQALGEVAVDRDFIQSISRDEELKQPVGKKEPVVWEKEASIGYTKSSGNTRNSQLSSKLSLHRKTDYNEFHFQADAFYSSANKKMDSQRYNAMTRYAYSFGDTIKWYHYYKLEADHDRFAKIDYRLTPSSGVGYWFSDKDDWKLMTECGLGWEYTDYRDDTKDETEAVFVPRLFFEKRLIGQSRITHDSYLYPSLEDSGDYRLHSETSFTNPINDEFALRVSFIDDYDSDPPKNTEKNDFRLISSLVYSF